jgi:hypothetical protein
MSPAAATTLTAMTMELKTPDGRYVVVQGRLWRAPNPTLPAESKIRHTRELLNGRRAMRAAKAAGDEAAIADARRQMRKAQEALGERGAVWWTDGQPDFNRRLAKLSPYAEWFARGEQEMLAA